MKFRLTESYPSIMVIKLLVEIIKLVDSTAPILNVGVNEMHIHHIRTRDDGNNISNLCLMSKDSHKDLHNSTTYRDEHGKFSKAPDMEQHKTTLEQNLNNYPDAYRLDTLISRLTNAATITSIEQEKEIKTENNVKEKEFAIRR